MAALIRTEPCWFRVDGQLAAVPTAAYRRTLLPVGEVFAGPAIVLQTNSTTVVPPNASAVVEGAGNIVINPLERRMTRINPVTAAVIARFCPGNQLADRSARTADATTTHASGLRPTCATMWWTS